MADETQVTTSTTPETTASPTSTTPTTPEVKAPEEDVVVNNTPTNVPAKPKSNKPLVVVLLVLGFLIVAAGSFFGGRFTATQGLTPTPTVVQTKLEPTVKPTQPVTTPTSGVQVTPSLAPTTTTQATPTTGQTAATPTP